MKSPASKIVARTAMMMNASLKSCMRPAFMFAFISMNDIFAPHLNLCPHTPVSVKSSKSENRCSLWSSLTVKAFYCKPRRSSPFLSVTTALCASRRRPTSTLRFSSSRSRRSAPGARRQSFCSSSRRFSSIFSRRHPSATNC